MKLTTTRDFRLNTKRLEEVMKRRREEEEVSSFILLRTYVLEKENNEL